MRIVLFALGLWAAAAAAQPAPSLRASTPDEQRLDATVFAGLDERIGERLSDVQSVVVVLQGRIAYQYHRDGNAETLRGTQSVAKSALAALVGVALRQGHIASLDQPVVDLMPEWRQHNADARAQTITLRHLLAMTAGFQVDDAAGTAPALAPRQAWARPLRSDPGQAFAYDNSIINLVIAVLEKAAGRPLADYAREELARPMEMADPQYRPGLHLRTVDMAKLGQLFLQDGAWNGQPLIAPGFAAMATRPHSGGGPPVHLPYGLFWWVPSQGTYFASGYGGQFIWVHAPLGLVVAVTSSVSAAGHQRGSALQLILRTLVRDSAKARGGRRALTPGRLPIEPAASWPRPDPRPPAVQPASTCSSCRSAVTHACCLSDNATAPRTSS